MRTDSWHTLSPSEAALRLKTDLVSGLAKEEAERRLQEFGPN